MPASAEGPGPAPRVLFARPDHVGDLLLTLPAVGMLRRALPDAHLGYVTTPAAAEAAERCPHVDTVHAVAFPPLRRPRWPADALRRAAETLRGRYDLALLPRPDDPASGALCAAAAIPERVGFALPRTRPFLTRACPVDSRNATLMAAEVVRAVLPEVPHRLSTDDCFRTTSDDAARADALLAGLPTPHPFAAVHPGSGWPLKNWPPSRWARLAQRLADHHLAPVALGSPDESPLVADTVGRSGGAAHALRPDSLAVLAEIHRRAAVVVGADSGAIHLAHLMGTPTVALFGPADPHLFRPVGTAPFYVVTVNLPCRPCGTLENPPCGARQDPACLTGIDVDRVLDAVAAARRSDRTP